MNNQYFPQQPNQQPPNPGIYQQQYAGNNNQNNVNQYPYQQQQQQQQQNQQFGGSSTFGGQQNYPGNAYNSAPQNQGQPEPAQNQQQQQQQQQNQHPNQQNQQQHMNHPLAHTSHTSHAMTRPPYVDPETQIVYPCSNPEFEGWLTKQSMWLKDWRRRYFILSGSRLFFAKNPFEAPHGMIDLGTATTVKSADIKSRKKFSFEISTHEMTFLMYADCEKEKDDWIGSVGRSIVRASGTFLTKNDVAGAGTATGAGNNNYGYGDDEDDDDDDNVFENSENHPYFND